MGSIEIHIRATKGFLSALLDCRVDLLKQGVFSWVCPYLSPSAFFVETGTKGLYIFLIQAVARHYYWSHYNIVKHQKETSTV